MTQTHIVILALAPFVPWRLYKRMRGRSPLTLAIFGTMALHYVVYGAGLLRWRRTEPTLEAK